MNKFLLSILILLTLNSCTERHVVNVNTDGSADIEYSMYYYSDKDTMNLLGKNTSNTEDSLSKVYKKFYKSKYIKDFNFELFENQSVKIKYKITDINKLGDFLCPSVPLNHPIKIVYSKKEFIIDAGIGDSNSEDDVGGYTNMLYCELKITFPDKIKKVNNEGGVNLTQLEKSIEIKSSMGLLNYSGKKNKITVKF